MHTKNGLESFKILVSKTLVPKLNSRLSPCYQVPIAEKWTHTWTHTHEAKKLFTNYKSLVKHNEFKTT